jgi:hypothetical protein
MMIRALLLLAAPLLSLTAFGTQPKPRKPLEWTVDIISQGYCAVNRDSSSLEMKLKLRFQNIGSQKLILYKGHDLFYQTKIRSGPGNPWGPYGVWVVNSRYFDQEVDRSNVTQQGLCYLSAWRCVLDRDTDRCGRHN